jgi:hypothetical protein
LALVSHDSNFFALLLLLCKYLFDAGVVLLDAAAVDSEGVKNLRVVQKVVMEIARHIETKEVSLPSLPLPVSVLVVVGIGIACVASLLCLDE